MVDSISIVPEQNTVLACSVTKKRDNKQVIFVILFALLVVVFLCTTDVTTEQ